MHVAHVFIFFCISSSLRYLDSISSTHITRENEISTKMITNDSLTSPTLQNFSCRYEEDNGLAIFCSNVDLQILAPNIPNETVHLEITDSPLPTFNKPYLSHLHNLTYLKLNHNHHKYITSKAFEGLHSLKVLDLSFNDIIVLSKAFTYTTNLEVLNLTSNQIINVKTIATALSHLEKFQNLSLNHNVRVRKILRDELLPFNNVTLVKLELFNTTIKLIEEHVFIPLRSLRLLELSVNYLDEIGLQNVTADLEETSIQILFLRNLNLQSSIPYEALSFLRNTSIQRLDMGYNYFPTIRKFPSIPALASLWLPFCSIQIIYPYAFENISDLEFLELSHNQIFHLSEALTSLPNLQHLILSSQQFPTDKKEYMVFTDFAFKNMSSLLRLDLRNVKTNGNITRYTFYGLRSLKVMYFSSSQIDYIEDFVFETLVSLQALDLKSNRLTCLTNYTFFGLKNINQIVLSQNKIKLTSGVYPFQDNPFVTFIALDRNKIVKIPAGIFARLSLLNALTLSENKIVAWNLTIFSQEANISALLLSRNKITHVTPAMIADFLLVNETLDITENPFNCTACGMKDFQTFMNETNVSLSFRNSKGAYSCNSPEEYRGALLLEVNIPTSHCLPDEMNMTLFITALMLSVIIPIMLIVVTCYTFRWYIRYWLFRLEATLKERKQSKNDLHQYSYDAFVSYNATDTPWVVSHLIPALEEQEPVFKLCIHERDFEVGRLITDNILDTIEVSRKVILLLSESFLSSEWCMFELHMAQHKLFDETRDVLLLVKLRNIDKKLYTHNLKYLLKTRPCLTWTDNPTGQKLFWNQMRKVLGKPSLNSERLQEVLHEPVLKEG